MQFRMRMRNGTLDNRPHLSRMRLFHAKVVGVWQRNFGNLQCG